MLVTLPKVFERSALAEMSSFFITFCQDNNAASGKGLVHNNVF